MDIIVLLTVMCNNGRKMSVCRRLLYRGMLSPSPGRPSTRCIGRQLSSPAPSADQWRANHSLADLMQWRPPLRIKLVRTDPCHSLLYRQRTLFVEI